MRAQEDTEILSLQTTVTAGFYGSIINLLTRYTTDCYTNQLIVNGQASLSWQSLFQKKIGWELAYRLGANTFSFPAQYHLKMHLKLNGFFETENYFHEILLNGTAGASVACAEALLFHPLDSMRKLVQTKSETLGNHSIHYYFTHYKALSRGMGIVVGRNMITNLVGWSIFAGAKPLFENGDYAQMAPSFLFAFSRILIGYPLTTLSTLMQTDTKTKAARTLKGKFQFAEQILKKRIREKGISSFFQGFVVQGSTQIFATFVQMWFFNWYLDACKKPHQSHCAFTNAHPSGRATEEALTHTISPSESINTCKVSV